MALVGAASGRSAEESGGGSSAAWLLGVGMGVGAAAVAYLVHRSMTPADDESDGGGGRSAAQRKAAVSQKRRAQQAVTPAKGAAASAGGSAASAATAPPSSSSSSPQPPPTPSDSLLGWLQEGQVQSAVSHATSPATAAAAQAQKAQQDAEAAVPLSAAEAAAAARAAGEPGSAYAAPQVPKRNTTKPKPKPGVAAKKKRPKPADTPATKAANEAKKLYAASDFGGAHAAFGDAIDLLVEELQAATLGTGAHGSADDSLVELAALNTQLRTAHFNRGRACQNLARQADAQEDFEAALRFDPAYAKARTRLAECHTALAAAITADWGSAAHAAKLAHQREAVTAHMYLLHECIASGRPQDLPAGTEAKADELLMALGKVGARQLKEQQQQQQQQQQQGGGGGGGPAVHKLPAPSLTVAFLESFLQPVTAPVAESAAEVTAALEAIDAAVAEAEEETAAQAAEAARAARALEEVGEAGGDSDDGDGGVGGTGGGGSAAAAAAEACAVRATELAGTRARCLCRRAQARKQERDFAGADADCAAAVALGRACMGDEAYARALNEHGTFMHLKGDYEGAAKALGESAALLPDLVNTRIKMGGVAFDSEDAEQALAHFNTACAMLENGAASPDALFHRGQMYLITEKYAKAIADLRRCTALAPAFALAHTQLGLAVFREAQAACENPETQEEFDAMRAQAAEAVQKAFAHCAKACELDPANPQSHNYWGELLFAMGDFEVAKEKFRAASAADHEFGHALVNLGLCELQHGQAQGHGAAQMAGAKKKAETYFQKALEVDPMCIPAHLHLATLHLDLDGQVGPEVAIPACEAAVAEYELALNKALSAKHQMSDLIDICQFRVNAEVKLAAYHLKWPDE
jgi:tetratricopeptide (TPR) repeat protein